MSDDTPTDIPALLAAVDAAHAGVFDVMTSGFPLTDAADAMAVFANSWPRVREEIARLQQVILYGTSATGWAQQWKDRDVKIDQLRAQLAQAETKLQDFARQAADGAAWERERLEMQLAQRTAALRKAVTLLTDLIHEGNIPRSCGACGTPNATCDGDCMGAAYLSRDVGELRRALADLQDMPRKKTLDKPLPTTVKTPPGDS